MRRQRTSRFRRPSPITVEDTILDNGGLTVEAQGVDLTDATFQWYIGSSKNGNFQTVETMKRPRANTADLFPCEGEPNTLFVARAGAQKWFYVEVTLADGLTTYTSEPVLVDYYDELQNGGFEDPSSSAMSDYRYNYKGAIFWQVPDSIDGLHWKTTGHGENYAHKGPDYFIEIVDGRNAKPAYNTTRSGRFARAELRSGRCPVSGRADCPGNGFALGPGA